MKRKRRYWFDLQDNKWKPVPKGTKYMNRWIELGFIPELSDLRPYWEAIRYANQVKHVCRLSRI